MTKGEQQSITFWNGSMTMNAAAAPVISLTCLRAGLVLLTHLGFST